VVDTAGIRSRTVDTAALAPGRTTVDVNARIGPDRDVSVSLSATGPVIVERPLYFSADIPNAGPVSGGSSVAGAEAGLTSLFAEGTTRAGFQEYLTLENPALDAVSASITYSITSTDGEHRQVPTTVVLPPGRTTVDVNAVVGGGVDVSVAITASGPVVVERPAYFRAAFANSGPVDGGTDSAGAAEASPVALFAEGTTRDGFQEYLTILNPSAGDLSATISFLSRSAPITTTVALPPGRTTVDVPAITGTGLDVSARVDATGPVVAERPIYVNAIVAAAGAVTGGSSVPAAGVGATSFLFAEGTTRPGFQEYLTLYNPGGSDADATITWDTTDAASGARSRLSRPVTLVPGRTTIDAVREVGPDKDVSVRVDADALVVAERPVYFRHDFPASGGIRQAVFDFFADPRVAGATVGVSIVLDGYGEIAGQNATVPLIPASNEKLFTAAGAFETLTTDTVLTTRVVATAAVNGKVLRGDLVLVGAGDPLLPTLGPSSSLDALAVAVANTGITQVAGALIGDETEFDAARTAPGWKASYLPDNDVGPLSALAVDGNASHPDDSGYLVDPVPANVSEFRDRLAAHGVAVAGPNVSGAAPATATVTLAAVRSAPVGTLLAEMLTYSDNFTAELTVKTVGSRLRHAGTTTDGLAAMGQAMTDAGLPHDGTATDGSGLSVQTRRSAATERALLEAARDRPWFESFYLSLPLAGVSGTLYQRFVGTAADRRLRAKTGTLSGVHALSGYVTTLGGRRVVFSVIANNSSSSVNGAIDDMMATIAADRS
jgi:D-alanyl-D-alanine carboxypeptidase/D-alanyl-D-alanine-endopeptidase (penicillin-binding protein 4)